MTERTEYTVTSGELARQAGIAAPTVTGYARLGLLDFIALANGTRLYRRGQADRVRQIYRQRVANRGRRKA